MNTNDQNDPINLTDDDFQISGSSQSATEIHQDSNPTNQPNLLEKAKTKFISLETPQKIMVGCAGSMGICMFLCMGMCGLGGLIGGFDAAREAAKNAEKKAGVDKVTKTNGIGKRTSLAKSDNGEELSRDEMIQMCAYVAFTTAIDYEQAKNISGSTWFMVLGLIF